VAFVLSISGFLTGALVAIYSFTHSFPYSLPLAAWESVVTFVFALAIWLISYDLRSPQREEDEE
jgi:hypothetical protein